jgi:hypothetical protein
MEINGGRGCRPEPAFYKEVLKDLIAELLLMFPEKQQWIYRKYLLVNSVDKAWHSIFPPFGAIINAIHAQV